MFFFIYFLFMPSFLAIKLPDMKADLKGTYGNKMFRWEIKHQRIW